MKWLVGAIVLFFMGATSDGGASEPILIGAFAFPASFAAPRDETGDVLSVLNVDLKLLKEWAGEKLVDHAYDARPLWSFRELLALWALQRSILQIAEP